MVCGGADCLGHISLYLNINTCGLGTNNQAGRWFMWVDWKAELHSWRFGKAPIRQCDCWLANQMSVRQLRFRGQTHFLLKACLFPTDITNVGLHSLQCLPTPLFNIFSLGFHLFSCSLYYLPPWLISLSPTSLHPSECSLHHYPAASPTWWEGSCQELRVVEKATAFLRCCAALPGSH